MAEENKWTGYMKYEKENTDNSETFIIYNFNLIEKIIVPFILW